MSARAGASGLVTRRVGLACNELIRARYVDAVDLARLEAAAVFSYHAFAVPSEQGRVRRDAAAEAELAAFAADLDVLLVCEGAPFVGESVLAAAPRLGLLGELEGDRFAYRLDLAAAHARSIVVVDTSHGSSWPTAEWALALALIGLRNAGALFRRMIAHEETYLPAEERSGPGYERAELSGKRVGMVGFGHVARRLVQLLEPFTVEVRVYDPYAPRELADPCNVDFGPLEVVLESDVVFVLVPQTPATEGLIGRAELELLAPGTVLVNVSRGKVIDTEALLTRLHHGDIVACLDVFDPEPLPLDSPLADLANVFVSPHVAGVTEESRRRFFSLMVDDCLRHFAGLEPRGALTAAVVALRHSSLASRTP
jgi:phosphoglycerate dehydrogenase-like enzyme